MFSFDTGAVRVAEVFGLRFGLGVRLLATDSRVPAWSVNGMIFDFLALVCLLWQRRLLLNPSSVRIAKAAKIIQLQASIRGMCVIANRAVISRMRDAFERYKVEQTKLILRSIELQRNGRRGLRDDAETAKKFSASFNQFNRALNPTTEQAVEEADAITESEEDELRSQLHISDEEETDDAGGTETPYRKSTSFSLGALSRSMTGFLPWARRSEMGESGNQVPNKAVSEPAAALGEPGVTADRTPTKLTPQHMRQSASTSALDTLANEEAGFHTLPSPSFSSAVDRAAARRRSRIGDSSRSPVHELSIEEERGNGTDHTTTDDEDEDEDKSGERSRAAATAGESKTEGDKGGGEDTKAKEAGKCQRMCSR